MTAVLQIYSLWLRDVRHFFRQRSRVIGAIGQPFVFWIFLNAGFSGSFSGGRQAMTYGTFLYPGVIVLIALFSAIFSTISIIEDRRSGFMQGVLASPVSMGAFVLSKLLAGATLALAQTALFMLLLPFAGIHVTAAGLLLSGAALLFLGMTLTNVGVIIAWKMKSTQGFHAIMNLLLVPMWMLSGSFFPPEGAAGWLQVIISVNPLYYLTTMFKGAFLFGTPYAASIAAPLAAATALSLVFAALLTTTAIRTVKSR